MYICIVCLSDNIKKVKTARLTQKQIAKDIQAIPSKNLDGVLYVVNIKLTPGFTVFISHYFFLTKILHCQNF